MVVVSLLLLLSLAGIAAALALPGLSDLLLLAGPCAIASLFLLAQAYRRHVRSTRTYDRLFKSDRAHTGRTRSRPQASQKWIVIDGSNVMHWKDNTPNLEPVREVVQHLSVLGFTPGVVFDANAGYLLTGRYQHHNAFGVLLGLPEDRVMVVPKGTPADPTILAAARDLGARIVTNDRFRDWAESHPEVRDPGYLIGGGYRDNRLWFDTGAVEKTVSPEASVVNKD